MDDKCPLPFLPPRGSWEEVLRRYGAKPNDGWFACIKPFARLVARVAASPWAERLYASTSHHWLVVAQVAGFPERIERPHLVVGPMPGEVEIERRRPPSLPFQPVDRVVVPIENAWDPLVDGFEWLVAAR